MTCQGEALEHASERLRGDATIASVACAKAGWALRHCSAALQDDERVVATAVDNDGSSLKFASARLQGDVRGRAARRPRHPRGRRPGLRADAGVCAACCARDGEALSLCLRRSGRIGLVLAAAKSRGAALRHVDDAKLLADADIRTGGGGDVGRSVGAVLAAIEAGPGLHTQSSRHRPVAPAARRRSRGPGQGRPSSTRSRETARPSSSPLMPLGPTPTW